MANGAHPFEVGGIGCEGMTGLPVILGGDRNEHETFIQAAGHGHCLRLSGELFFLWTGALTCVSDAAIFHGYVVELCSTEPAPASRALPPLVDHRVLLRQ